MLLTSLMIKFYDIIIPMAQASSAWWDERERFKDRGRERERKKERNREKERKKERKKERENERKIERERKKERERKRERKRNCVDYRRWRKNALRLYDRALVSDSVTRLVCYQSSIKRIFLQKKRTDWAISKNGIFKFKSSVATFEQYSAAFSFHHLVTLALSENKYLYLW